MVTVFSRLILVCVNNPTLTFLVTMVRQLCNVSITDFNATVKTGGAWKDVNHYTFSPNGLHVRTTRTHRFISKSPKCFTNVLREPGA